MILFPPPPCAYIHATSNLLLGMLPPLPHLPAPAAPSPPPPCPCCPLSQTSLPLLPLICYLTHHHCKLVFISAKQCPRPWCVNHSMGGLRVLSILQCLGRLIVRCLYISSHFHLQAGQFPRGGADCALAHCAIVAQAPPTYAPPTTLDLSSVRSQLLE